LATLAISGPVAVVDLLKSTKMSPGTYEKLVKDGLLVRTPLSKGSLIRQAVTISPTLAGREELIALLKRIADVWPVEHLKSVGPVVIPRARHLAANCYFGSKMRSEILLTIAAVGIVDVAILKRMMNKHDPAELSRGVRMWQAYGIVRDQRLDGRATGYELNPDWYAATELRALLDVLTAADGRFAARAAGVEIVMPPRRLKRRQNAAKAKKRAAGPGR
jgi:hypothetical protein